MNVITVRQPYASLIVAGIKLWETRPYPPNGDMRPKGVRGLPGLRIDRGERIAIHAAQRWAPGWLRWYSPERSDADSDRLNVLESVGVDFHECGDNWWKIDTRSLPLGAIIGIVEVTRCLPVADYDTCTFGIHEPHICTSDSGRDLALVENGAETTISDQLPYGDWQPGRWAWRLVDPQPCDPIPAKGKQGVWSWEP